MDHAHAHAHLRPDRVAHRLHLSRDQWTVSRAVSFLPATTSAWAVPDCTADDAHHVAKQLVENALRHARTPSVLHASLDPAGLRIAVRDFHPGVIGRPQGGLGLVSSLARRWGVLPRSNGKTVWALLGNEVADLQLAVGEHGG